jgi:uncharacterized repeat protein (TIGR03803 family)
LKNSRLDFWNPIKTSIQNLFRLPALIAGLGLLPACQVAAQTFTNLHNFTATVSNTNSDGSNPHGRLVLSGNILYGTANNGGKFGSGTVFAVNTNGTGFTNLYTFTATSGSNSTNSDGAKPKTDLILSGNTLYGTAYYGGTNGNGTVFAVSTNGTGFTTLHSFSSTNANGGGVLTNSDGANPSISMILWGNTLYATASYGGTNGNGTVFAVSTNGASFTVLHTFTAGSGSLPKVTNSDGALPFAGLIISGNTLYGTATYGGTNGNGTLFAVNTNGTGFTNLYTFTATSGSNSTNSEGANPDSLILSGNTLYGTTLFGGTNGNGTVFAVSTNGTGFKDLHSFSATNANAGGVFTNSDGANPQGGLILSGNILYGIAIAGGTNGNGTVFAINTNGAGFTTLYDFTALNNNTNSDGAKPQAGLILSGNTLYGTAKDGGSSGNGTVFSLSLGAVSAPQLAILHSGTNVIVTWPTNATGYTLQSTTNLAPPAVWTTVSPAPVVINTNNVVTNAISGKTMFYQLEN